MIVEKIAVERFRALADAELTFAPGLNIIRGPNEAGKSSVVLALLTALFTRASSAAIDVKEMRAWGAERAMILRLDLRDGDERFELTRDFEGRRQSLRPLPNGDALSDPNAIEQHIVTMLGCPSALFFQSTAFIRHDDLAQIDRDKNALSRKLRDRATGSDEIGVEAALQRLKDHRTYVLRGVDRPAPNNPGPLSVLREQKEAFTRDRARVANATQERVREIESRDNAHVAVSECEARLAERRAVSEVSERVFRAWERRQALAATIDARDEIERLRPQLGADSELDTLRASRDAQNEQLAHARGLAFAAAEAAAAPPPHPAAPPPIPARSPAILIAGGALVILGAIAAYLFGVAGLVVSIVGVALIVIDRRAAPAPLLAAPPAPEGPRRPDASAQLAALLAEAGFQTIDDFESSVAGLTGRIGAIEQAQARLGQIIGREPTTAALDEFVARAREAGRERSDLADRLDADKARDMLSEVYEAAYGAGGGDDLRAPQALQRLKDEVTRIGSERDQAHAAAARADGRLELLPDGDDDALTLDERIAQVDEDISRWQRRRAAVDLAIETIETEQRALLRSVASEIEPMVAARLARATAGRFTAVSIDPSTLAITVTHPANANDVPAAMLSRGTRDQLYLAARLALVDRLCGEARPPIVIDDGLIAFDDARAAAMLDVLREEARERQVLLFTWSDRYDAAAERVIEMREGVVVAVRP
ncbi:MAG: hypothetical protein EPO26_13260 [Chloroflexota bacterium]|nr:MAG: hypothetical protein EPO26_13260 [Chloroflexota bacterium]